MPHNFEAMAAELKSAVRGKLEATQTAELLINRLGAAGSTSPFIGVVSGDMRRSVDTLAEAYGVIKSLADGKLKLVEVAA